jgi:hypothetical protein
MNESMLREGAGGAEAGRDEVKRAQDMQGLSC